MGEGKNKLNPQFLIRPSHGLVVNPATKPLKDDDDDDDDTLNYSFYEQFPPQSIPKIFKSQDITFKFCTFAMYVIYNT